MVRGEELVTDKYPEFQELADTVPDGTVLDGEILPYVKDEIGIFNQLQTRIGRKNVSKKLLSDVPVIFKAYDILEYKGIDIRPYAYEKRREILEQLVREWSCFIFTPFRKTIIQ